MMPNTSRAEHLRISTTSRKFSRNKSRKAHHSAGVLLVYKTKKEKTPMFDVTHLFTFILGVIMCLAIASAYIYAVNPDDDDLEN